MMYLEWFRPIRKRSIIGWNKIRTGGSKNFVGETNAEASTRCHEIGVNDIDKGGYFVACRKFQN